MCNLSFVSSSEQISLITVIWLFLLACAFGRSLFVAVTRAVGVAPRIPPGSGLALRHSPLPICPALLVSWVAC
jgi:hypothetical protein